MARRTQLNFAIGIHGPNWFQFIIIGRFPPCVLLWSRHVMVSTNPCTLELFALSFSPYRDRVTFNYSYHAYYGVFVLIGRNWHLKREIFF